MSDHIVLGELGEKLVELHFANDFERFTDQYDERGDGVFKDGTIAEVKTQAIFKWFKREDMFRPEPAFTVPFRNAEGWFYQNQFEKCKTVERLFFVAVPYDQQRSVDLYEAPPPDKRNWFLRKGRVFRKWDMGILVKDCKLLQSFDENSTVTEAFVKYSGNTDIDYWESQYR